MVGYPKPKPIRLPRYLEFLTTLPCTRCNRVKSEYLDIVPAHQGFGYDPGMATKNNDNLALPLCTECHDREHHGAKTFWKGFDRKMAIIKCLTLYLWRH
ncbi:MAG: DUF968 domain-containing protein [Deltaproteobacteria bacterium]|nr:DUF968 domain-containing protein [Deltaproteobacteria bacterium]MBW1845576.1 DUF968 domain-containing protein [Deltaproteobacteria bacterium]MBW2032005.1 DUF968 domain-containing protein [Deltaproteobacteria bacterium]MBW2180965.1 DUF968 domain-containing protein [Deltaproteobacteria bacterium]